MAPACFTGNEGWVPHCPDFLWRPVALIHLMRLSLLKGAHADLSSTAWQEIGVKPGFGLSGISQHSTRFFLPLGAANVSVARETQQVPPMRFSITLFSE